MTAFFKQVFDYINPDKNEEIQKASKQWSEQLPTLWLLGKTGAGKSSLIQAFTGDTAIEIGNGFSPCTKTAEKYDYPQEKPIMRFLDTRGLSEADYDPAEDIKTFEKSSHALLLVMKAEEPEQSDLVHSIKKIRETGAIKHLLVVHTGIFSVDAKERDQAINHNQHQVEEAWGEKIDSVSVDLSVDDRSLSGINNLIDKTSKILPLLNAFMDEGSHTSREEENFNLLRTEIIWYSGSAGASDLLPGVGIVSVPAIQGKMLHSLANQYGITWNKQIFMEFMGILGTSFAVKYSARFAIREAVKFIPVYGQTVGAGAAAVISSASTYALGRVACKYLYHKSRGETVSTHELQNLYKDALRKGKEAAKK